MARYTLTRALLGSTALGLVAIAAPAWAADGGPGGAGDAASVGNGGNGGATGLAGTAGGTGLGGGGAGGGAGTAPGGNGLNGSAGFNTSPGIGAAGGGGGGGASGSAITSLGGNGGNGGNAGGTGSSGYGGGGGGGGGNGVDSVNFPTNDTPSLGGRGGNGGNAAGSPSGAGNGGAGGAGGYGAGAFTYSFTNVAGVTIGDGAGGNGGSGSGMQFSTGAVAGNGGAGGVGGAGIVASIANIFNAGTITGGTGGQGGARGTTGVAGAAGAGGVGITGDFLSIVNSGTISGGLSGDGVTRANAITFTGGRNSLALQAGYSVVGNVVAASRADVLSLGGTASSSFDVASLGDTAQYRGFGTLQKAGSSTWELFGTSNFAGTLDIQGGTVNLGALINGANTIVRSGASLVGSGGIGSLDAQAGSIIAPGRGTDPGNSSSYGRLSVNGNLIFRQGSTYQVSVNTGTSDVIQATGSAVIEGGRVQVLAVQAANYARVTEYSIIRAASITGQFSELTSDLAFVTPSLTYGADRVNLVFTRNDVPVRSVATTANQAGVAAALESLGGRNQVLAAVLLQNPEGARAALNLLAGEAAPSSTSAQIELMTIMSAMIMTSAFSNFGGLLSTGTSPLLAGAEVNADYAADMPGKPPGGTRMAIGNLDPKMYSMWGSAFGSFGSTTTNGNAGTLTRDVGGFVVGADATFDQMYRIGIAGGYARSSFDVRSRASSGETDTGFGAIYGGASFGPVTLRLGGLFAGMSSDTRRSIVFPGFADNVSARFGGTGLLGFGEVGYRFDVGPAGVEPFVGGSGMRLSRDGYTERGGPAALTVLQRDYDIQTFTVGARASAPLWFDDAFTVRGQLAYRRAFGDVVPTALLAFAGGGTQFQTAGIPIDVNAVVAEAGIGWQATKDIALELAYTGQVGKRAEDHGLKGSMLWKF